MPLTAGRRDEENERFKNTLQRLVALTFVPENLSKIDDELLAFDLDLRRLETMSGEELLSHVKTQKLDFENAEVFADFLAQGFPMLAKSVYQYIQNNSGTFSLGIFNKISALKI